MLACLFVRLLYFCEYVNSPCRPVRLLLFVVCMGIVVLWYMSAKSYSKKLKQC